MDAFKAFQKHLASTTQFANEEGRAPLVDTNWTPGGRTMFSAQLGIPAEMRHLALVLKDTAIEALANGPYQSVKVNFPKTAGQRSRGKVIGICCSFTEELMASKLGAGNCTVGVVHSPNRVQVTHGINVMTVVKLA